MTNQDNSMNNINKYSHPIPTKDINHTHRVIKNIFNMYLILNQKKTSAKIHKFDPYQIKSQMQQLTHTQTENPSKTIPEKNKYLSHKYSAPGT